MRRIGLVALLVAMVCLAFPVKAHADFNDFLITDFSADETLTKHDPQGELHIIEHIQVNYLGHNHGILRAIPASYKGHTLKFHLNSIRSDTAAPTAVSTSSSNGNVVLKIGDANKLVTGNQEYTIDYSLQNVISFYNDHDELYWDVNGDQWQEPFANVTATLHIPRDLQLSSQPPKCFAGANGSTDQNCTIALQNQTITANTKDLGISQTLTYVVGFQKGYFAPMTLREKVADYAAPILEVGLPILLSFVGSLLWWLKRGRDAKGRGTIVPEYQAPDGLSPLEAGTLIDFKVDNRDITATILDLARRGYLKIIENRTGRGILTFKASYTLVLTQIAGEGLNGDELLLLHGLFPEQAVGAEVTISDLKNKLYKVATELRKTVTARLTAQGYFRTNPYLDTKVAAYGGVIFFGIIFMVSGLHLASSVIPLTIGLIGAVVIVLVFMRIMPSRTAKGVAANEQLKGLKLYMETAEKDRLEKLEGPHAEYAANASAPNRTVELFEKLLPYAIVMGVETKWAGKFKDIYTTPPDWYSGSWAAFNAETFVWSLNNGFSQAVGATFTSPSSSSSSGFGGGGFAGGGGGGGGGGGW